MIIVNRIQCLSCGDIITSRHRHDYVSCKCGKVSVDGGLSYLRRNGGGYKEMSVGLDSLPFKEIRELFETYSHSKQEYVLLKDMEDGWLDRLIDASITFKPNSVYTVLYLQEKQFRNEENTRNFVEGTIEQSVGTP